ncbi:arginine repressor [Furfurilactobacillus sp. WILCCON 0119]|uniref:arginine repressor n=1 Tax=Furfurilactobacillus entadae TaxID=2922307 RepID=UPI0035EBEB36
MIKKQERQAVIRRVVANNVVRTQTELVGLLGDEGLDVTQATVSRDITELQLIKMPDDEGHTYYTFAADRPVDGEAKLRRNLNGNVINISVNDHFCLLNVLPGNGPVIGSLIKQLKYPEVFGVLSDDSTVLVIATDAASAQKTQDRFITLGTQR